MKKQIWGKHLEKNASKDNIIFCSGRDVQSRKMADEELVIFDLWTNYAHCQMLQKQKIITDSEWKSLNNYFQKILENFNKGKFVLDPALEDVHINIESYISQTCKAGKKIHTARSRNDQVTTTMRLYLRQKLIFFIKQFLVLIETILKRATLEVETVTIGFSHYQPAMPTTLAHWMTNWSQSLLRSSNSLLQNLLDLNVSPLGAVAGFGTTWKINREYSASLLAFDKVQENSLDCISSRGESETRVAANCSIFMNQVCILAQDLILLSHPYFGIVKIDESFVTGSSIMPHKKNPDFAEVIRAKTSLSHGILQSLLGITKGVISGYNRDSQQTKYLIMDLFYEIEKIPQILSGVISKLKTNTTRMEKLATNNYAISTDLADYLAANCKIAFRDSYNLVALAIKFSDSKIEYQNLKKAAQELKIKLTIPQQKLETILCLDKPMELLKKKIHTGAPAPVAVIKMIQNQTKILQQQKIKIKKFSNNVTKLYQKCFPKSVVAD